MTTDIDRTVTQARAELVTTLNSLEDKLNLPKQVRLFRQEHPNAFIAVSATAALGLAGAVFVGVLVARRR
jgi:ABC-type enterobactin transport system permease subunit